MVQSPTYGRQRGDNRGHGSEVPKYRLQNFPNRPCLGAGVGKGSSVAIPQTHLFKFSLCDGPSADVKQVFLPKTFHVLAEAVALEKLLRGDGVLQPIEKQHNR
eukprot:NODE_1919_length_529_cov_494.516667_g1561_i0.p2 GENE.NODE_1919_length_529_cov_494.516667_g1561_i0~~NODE_1919_length_529_cov_494.516667_g1561_i0.p2  ORF type:complete len:103 (-),score=6.55 NODE_1919_length_529_cov_494.516667_g1561_i0:204-512(-)